MPRISAFAKQHPAVSLFVSASPQHSDFQLGMVDVDIRYGVPNWQHVEIEPMAVERIQPLASPEFLKRHKIRRKEELLRVPLIHSTVNRVQWADWFEALGSDARPHRFELSFDRAMMSLDAAAQGIGVAFESHLFAESYLKKKMLMPVLGPQFAVSLQAHFAVYPLRNAARPEVLQFLKWLHQAR